MKDGRYETQERTVKLLVQKQGNELQFNSPKSSLSWSLGPYTTQSSLEFQGEPPETKLEWELSSIGRLKPYNPKLGAAFHNKDPRRHQCLNKTRHEPKIKIASE